MLPLHNDLFLAYPNLNTFQSLLYQDRLGALLYNPYFQFRPQLQLPQAPFIAQDLYRLRNPMMKAYLQAEPLDFSGYGAYLNADGAKTESSTCKMEGSESQVETPLKMEEFHSSQETTHYIKSQIINMIRFILSEFGKAKKDDLQNHRKLYAHNPILCELFDTLVEKFSSAVKCREDMVRFVLRKTISSLRDSLRSSMKLSSKAASLALCKKYFNLNDEELIKQELDTENEEELLNFLLPYKKNSRNKTANTRFMTEIFSSEAFYQDYKDYLTKFDDILEKENQKKIEKFIEFVEGCVQKKSLNDIKRFKRLPWVKVWLDATKIIAYELLNNKTWKTKKVKATKANRVKDEGISS